MTRIKYMKKIGAQAVIVLIMAVALSINPISTNLNAQDKEDVTPWVKDYQKAKERSGESVPQVKDVLLETPVERRKRLGDKEPKLDDIKFNYFLMDSPAIRRESDLYGPVRFMHKKHAGLVNDCLLCHHYRPADPKAPEVSRCLSCHQAPFQPELAGRISLKAALHRQCMDCHRKWNKGPLGCNDCHIKNTPDHNDLVVLPKNPTPTEVTKECIRCHETQADEMLTSTHWLWKGSSPYTEDHEHQVDLGKATSTVNNSMIHVASNEALCTSCHAGYGFKDSTFDFTDKTKIDCLVCHDTTREYQKDPKGAGMPAKDVDLVKVAKNVGKTSRKSCGDCHFSGSGDEHMKHGKLNPFLDFHNKNSDIHMGGLGFQCYNCHETKKHKISGRSLALPVVEGSRSCSDCHTEEPHQGKNLLTHHLNRHTKHMACMTCHTPVYALYTPVKTYWDWSEAGQKDRKVNINDEGMPDYDWKYGSFLWESSIKPVFAWYNGKVKRYILGDKINQDGVIALTEPVGDIKDPKSTIYPFKVMKGKQAADKNNNYLLVPNYDGPEGFWKTLDWNKAFKKGTSAAGLSYSGEYEWVETSMYVSLTHEVMAKNFALSCVQCHPSLRKGRSCGRCHTEKKGVNFEELAYKGVDFKFLHRRTQSTEGLTNGEDYIDFKKLGYKGDPIVHGGRFKQLPLGWSEDKEKK